MKMMQPLFNLDRVSIDAHQIYTTITYIFVPSILSCSTIVIKLKSWTAVLSQVTKLKMSNRRVKSLDYDDDDLDYDEGFEEEYDGGQEEVSAEDKEQLRLGTIEVRKVLGSGYQATDAEIQDALWNYYYDIAKTVTFIKSEQEKGCPSSSSSLIHRR